MKEENVRKKAAKKRQQAELQRLGKGKGKDGRAPKRARQWWEENAGEGDGTRRQQDDDAAYYREEVRGVGWTNAASKKLCGSALVEAEVW